MSGRRSELLWVIAAGAGLGLAGSLLAFFGNPQNTGICISCFLENFAGAVGLHSNARMQYVRPELLGFFLGSFAMAGLSREVRVRSSGGGAGAFLLGFFMLVGSAVFIGCPIKLLLRLAAVDLTAVTGVFGLVAGVWIGLKTLAGPETGIFSESSPGPLPVFVLLTGGAGLLAGLAFADSPLVFSTTGGGAVHAPKALSLGAGLAVGALAQRSRFCVTGSVRDVLLTRSLFSAAGLIAALSIAFGADIFTGQVNVGYYDQPGAHLEPLWGFLAMALTGWAAVIAGGCPFRQIVKAGEGDLDAFTVCFGMLAGAVVVQSWALGASSAGVPPQGKAAVLLGFAVMASLGLRREKR